MLLRARLTLFLALCLAVAPRAGFAQWQVNGTPVCDAANGQHFPKIVTDGAGGAIVIWQDGRAGNTHHDIYVQRVLVSGAADPAWPATGTLLCSGANSTFVANELQIVADGAGGAFVTWQDLRSLTDYDIYAQHVLASGIVDPAWTANGTLLCNAGGNQEEPTIVGDGVGGAIVAWHDFRGGSSDIYALRVLASGVVDPTWTANGTLLCNASDNQRRAQIVSDGAGGAIVTWDDFRNGNADVFAQHLLASGSVDPAWPTNGTLLCNAANTQFHQQITSDGAGGAIVTWDDARGGSTDIYAQRVLASGSVDPAWTPNGTLLCNETGGQSFPRIVADGAGGAFVAWEDFRGTATDIYAHHVLASGVVDPAWNTNGTLVCDAANTQDLARIILDGAGGVIIAWRDRRGGANFDIYVQRVLVTGAVDPAWTANGTLLCDAANEQSNPAIVADGAGGAFVTWHDFRSGTNFDIYAQRVYGGGGVAAVLPGDRRPFTVEAPRPNPTASGATISFDLPVRQRVSVTIFDVSGHLVRRLASEREIPAGRQNLIWDATTDDGTGARAGIYFVQVKTGDFSVARRLAVLR